MSAAEAWATVSGYEGYYEVSNLGRVRSVTRVITHSRGTQTYPGKVLAPWIHKNGYPHVTLWRDRKRATTKVHRLVARAFVRGEALGLEVCHNDGNPTNNVASNLRWDTHLANMHDRWEHHRARGES